MIENSKYYTFSAKREYTFSHSSTYFYERVDEDSHYIIRDGDHKFEKSYLNGNEESVGGSYENEYASSASRKTVEGFTYYKQVIGKKTTVEARGSTVMNSSAYTSFNSKGASTRASTRTATTRLFGEPVSQTTEIEESNVETSETSGSQDTSFLTTITSLNKIESDPYVFKSTSDRDGVRSTVSSSNTEGGGVSYDLKTTTSYNSTELNSFETTSMMESANYPEKVTATVTRFGQTLTELKTILNYTTLEKINYIQDTFSVNYNSRGVIKDHKNPQNYDLDPEGEKGVIYYISTFAENNNAQPAGFYVFNYAGSYKSNEANLPLLAFSEALSKAGTSYSWSTDPKIITIGEYEKETVYGESIASKELSFELYNKTIVAYEHIGTKSSFVDSSFYVGNLETITFTKIGRDSTIHVNENVNVGIGYITSFGNSYKSITKTTVIKTDPLNFKTTIIQDIIKEIISYKVPYISKSENIWTDTEISSESSFRTDYDQNYITTRTSDYGETNDRANYKGFSSSSFKSGFSQTIKENGIGTNGLITNLIGGVRNFEGYAIKPDYKKGFVGFEEAFELYGASSILKLKDSGSQPIFNTYCFQNYNQTKIDLDCIIFSEKETYSLIKKYLSANLTFSTKTASYTESDYRGVHEVFTTQSSYYYTYSLLTASSSSTFSYEPNYSIFSSIIDDKQIAFFYTISKRSDYSTAFEIEENAITLKLLNKCDNTNNFLIQHTVDRPVGGKCPKTSDSWTFFYKGHALGTRVFTNGSSATLNFFNTTDNFNSFVFADGEALVVEGWKLYRPQGGQHYIEYS